MKICKGLHSCGVEKSVTDFYLTKYKKPDNLCKKCKSKLNSNRDKLNREKRGPLSIGRPPGKNSDRTPLKLIAASNSFLMGKY